MFFRWNALLLPLHLREIIHVAEESLWKQALIPALHGFQPLPSVNVSCLFLSLGAHKLEQTAVVHEQREVKSVCQSCFLTMLQVWTHKGISAGWLPARASAGRAGSTQMGISEQQPRAALGGRWTPLLALPSLQGRGHLLPTRALPFF